MNNYPPFNVLLGIVLFSSGMLVLGLYLLANFNRLLRGIRNEWLRKNFVVWMISICLMLALSPTNPETSAAIAKGLWWQIVLAQLTAITIMVIIVFNISLLVWKSRPFQHLSFRKKMGVILATIIACTMFTGLLMGLFRTKGSFENMGLILVYNFYTGVMTGLVFITMSFVELERSRKLSEKELEVSRMRELKTKAELEALHSKINPHFLYNALNSIADLSVTDGRKARQMTVGLADLFRFSINYSDHNYSTVAEEVEMAEVYLQIEKIRFEDQLTYSVDVDNDLKHYLLPRFVLQPIVENAVKHGLKATGRMTQIILEVKKETGGLVLKVADNGPDFPEELNPGYGVRSVFDKLDLLFTDVYEIYFTNQPRKEVAVHIKKLIKNEPGV